MFRRELAIVLINLGKLLLKLGRIREAEDVLRRPPAICEALVAESPKVPVYRENLVLSLAVLASAQRESGQTSIALSNARRAEVIYAALKPENPVARRDMAKNLGCMALLLEESAAMPRPSGSARAPSSSSRSSPLRSRTTEAFAPIWRPTSINWPGNVSAVARPQQPTALIAVRSSSSNKYWQRPPNGPTTGITSCGSR